MKKKILGFLIAAVLLTTANSAKSMSTNNSEVFDAIELYKDQNYTECYYRLTEYVKQDNANALAFYYLAMSATQIGKEEEALENYSRAINLAPRNSNLSAYAQKGKLCIETPDACTEEVYTTPLENFIRDNAAPLSETVNSKLEQLKIEEMMRKMNRFEDIKKDSFKEFRDFSSMNNANPTNDEIVAALRVLQKAGLTNNMTDITALTGINNNQSSLINMMGGTMNPQLIQTLLTNNMSLGF